MPRLLHAVVCVALVATATAWRVAAEIAAIGSVDNANCALCAGLEYCTALNGMLLYDPIIGYTRDATPQLEKQGVCEDLDAKVFALTQFGDQFQFKDSPRCRTLVWTYHCLSLAATTHRRIVSGSPVSCSNAAAAGSATTPLPPCRSLCVEVADKCVYSHFYRDYLENVCGNVPCVSEQQEAASNGSLKQAPCVKAPWESVVNTSFSRCSIREYVAPKATSNRLISFTMPSIIASMLTIIYCL